MNALMTGPVAILLNTGYKGFRFYSDGVYQHSCQFMDPSVDIHERHWVTVVGYDQRWWKVKNSWGASWGKGGYFYLAKSAINVNVGCIISAAYPY